MRYFFLDKHRGLPIMTDLKNSLSLQIFYSYSLKIVSYNLVTGYSFLYWYNYVENEFAIRKDVMKKRVILFFVCVLSNASRSICFTVSVKRWRVRRMSSVTWSILFDWSSQKLNTFSQSDDTPEKCSKCLFIGSVHTS